MTTAVSESLTRKQQVQSLETYVPKDLLDSLGGVDNVLRTIPQNNNFPHPTNSTNLTDRCAYRASRSYGEIDSQHHTEISISKDVVIFIVRRSVEKHPHSLKNQGLPVSLIAFSNMQRTIYGPYCSTNCEMHFTPRLWETQASNLVRDPNASISETRIS